MRAEEALGDPAVLLPGEGHAVALQVVDASGGALGDDLSGAGVGEQIALLERVGRVLLPAVLGIHGGQGRVDSSGGECRMGVLLGTLADREYVDTGLGQLDRRSQPSTSGADHQHHGGKTLFGDSHGLLRSPGLSPSTTGPARNL